MAPCALAPPTESNIRFNYYCYPVTLIRTGTAKTILVAHTFFKTLCLFLFCLFVLCYILTCSIKQEEHSCTFPENLYIDYLGIKFNLKVNKNIWEDNKIVIAEKGDSMMLQK